MKDKGCKLSFKYWDKTISISCPHSEITDSEFFDMVKTILFSTGFSRVNIENHLIELAYSIEEERKKL
jgi:hypothetical protein